MKKGSDSRKAQEEHDSAGSMDADTPVAALAFGSRLHRNRNGGDAGDVEDPVLNIGQSMKQEEKSACRPQVAHQDVPRIVITVIKVADRIMRS